MCTAVTYQTRDFYFGRTLDYEKSFGEEVVIVPRHMPLLFREKGVMESHYAMIGIAHVEDDYPLYYDAVNEKGLCMAGLNFEGNAYFRKRAQNADNIAQFEFLPWILGQCSSVEEAKGLLKRINLDDEPFREALPPAPLHWMIADRREAVTVESVREGIMVYRNPVGILTNNPPFPQQMFSLHDYMGLSAKEPENRFSEQLLLQPYSRGMGALGLPGDLSSRSRFVRAAFTKLNSVSGSAEEESVSQVFHILGSVSQTRGCCDLGGGLYERTVYTSCCNAETGTYYYTTYDNHQITAVDMRNENLEGTQLIRYPLRYVGQVFVQNPKSYQEGR